MPDPIEFGKFRLMEELGKGGYGTVYRAIDTMLDVERAIKVLHPALVADLEFVERFRREARLMAKLEHPHLIPVYEMGHHQGSFFLAMRLLPGGSVRDYLKRQGRFQYPDAMKVLKEISSALDYVHALPEQLIHRDIKPANILFDADGSARLSDLGFAKALVGGSSVALSQSGGMMGTPPYMAPEIWQNMPSSPALDVYSLACTFVEMLTGEVLFDGDSSAAVMTRHVLEPPKYPANWPAGVPKGIEVVLNKGLAKSPADRYQSAGEFYQALVALSQVPARPKAQEAAPVIPSRMPAPLPGSSPVDKPPRDSGVVVLPHRSSDLVEVLSVPRPPISQAPVSPPAAQRHQPERSLVSEDQPSPATPEPEIFEPVSERPSFFSRLFSNKMRLFLVILGIFLSCLFCYGLVTIYGAMSIDWQNISVSTPTPDPFSGTGWWNLPENFSCPVIPGAGWFGQANQVYVVDGYSVYFDLEFFYVWDANLGAWAYYSLAQANGSWMMLINTPLVVCRDANGHVYGAIQP